VVGRQPNLPAAFILGEIPVTHFLRLSRPKAKDTLNIQLQIICGYDSHLNRVLAHSVGTDVSEGRA